MSPFELILTGLLHLLLAFVDVVIVFLIARMIVRVFPTRLLLALDQAGARLVNEVGWIIHTWWLRAFPRRSLSSIGRDGLSMLVVLVIRLLISLIAMAVT